MRYAVLSSVSRCYPPHKGRLLTRYSPVRHWSPRRVHRSTWMCYARRQRSSWARIKLSNKLYQFTLPSVLIIRAIYLSFFYFLELCSLWFFFDRFFFALAFFALYFLLLLFNCQVSILLTKFSWACPLYHFSFILSIGFWNFFQNFFDIFQRVICGRFRDSFIILPL